MTVPAHKVYKLDVESMDKLRALRARMPRLQELTRGTPAELFVWTWIAPLVEHIAHAAESSHPENNRG